MKAGFQKDNNKYKNSADNRSLEKDISNMKLNRMEDDIKNIINEKDEIIKNMNDKILRLENIIKDQSEKNEKLFQMINSMNEFNDKLKRSNYFDIEISGTDREINGFKGIGLDLEVFNENSFYDYFKTENQLEPNKIIFTIRQKKNEKIPINELVSNLVSKLLFEFIPPESHLYEKYKDKGIQFKIRENNKDCTFIDFYVDEKFLSDIIDDQNKERVNDKENENKKDNNINENQDKDDDIFKTIYQKIQIPNIINKSDFNLYFKMFLRTDFLFKNLFEEDIEILKKNILNSKLIINSDINTKIFLLSIIDILIKDANKGEDENFKDLLSLIKGLISIPLKKIKYDMTVNKKDIYDLIIKLYNKFEQDIKKLKNIYNSKDFIEELFKDEQKNFKEVIELFYKIIDFNEFGFAFWLNNNKLGFQIKTNLPEDNKTNFLFLCFPIVILVALIIFLKFLAKSKVLE